MTAKAKAKSKKKPATKRIVRAVGRPSKFTPGNAPVKASLQL
jgi:hypothetical protein